MPSLYYNDQKIADFTGKVDTDSMKRLIQKHLNNSNKTYQYVVKDVKQEGSGLGKLNLQVLARGDKSFRSEEINVKSYSIK